MLGNGHLLCGRRRNGLPRVYHRHLILWFRVPFYGPQLQQHDGSSRRLLGGEPLVGHLQRHRHHAFHDRRLPTQFHRRLFRNHVGVHNHRRNHHRRCRGPTARHHILALANTVDWGIGHRVLYHRPAAIARWRFGKGVFGRSHWPDKKQTTPQTKHKRQGHLGCLPHHFHRLHPLLQVLGHGLVRQCELFNDLFGHGRVLNPQFQRRVFPLACHRIRRNLLLFHFRCELHPTLFHGHEVKDTPAFPQFRVQTLPLVGTGFHGFHHG